MDQSRRATLAAEVPQLVRRLEQLGEERRQIDAAIADVKGQLQAIAAEAEQAR